MLAPCCYFFLHCVCFAFCICVPTFSKSAYLLREFELTSFLDVEPLDGARDLGHLALLPHTTNQSLAAPLHAHLAMLDQLSVSINNGNFLISHPSNQSVPNFHLRVNFTMNYACFQQINECTLHVNTSFESFQILKLCQREWCV